MGTSFKYGNLSLDLKILLPSDEIFKILLPFDEIFKKICCLFKNLVAIWRDFLKQYFLQLVTPGFLAEIYQFDPKRKSGKCSQCRLMIKNVPFCLSSSKTGWCTYPSVQSTNPLRVLADEKTRLQIKNKISKGQKGDKMQKFRLVFFCFAGCLISTLIVHSAHA